MPIGHQDQAAERAFGKRFEDRLVKLEGEGEG